jgi:hypothetical protein
VKQYAGTTNMCGGSVDLNYKNWERMIDVFL